MQVEQARTYYKEVSNNLFASSTRLKQLGEFNEELFKCFTSFSKSLFSLVEKHKHISTLECKHRQNALSNTDDNKKWSLEQSTRKPLDSVINWVTAVANSYKLTCSRLKTELGDTHKMFSDNYMANSKNMTKKVAQYITEIEKQRAQLQKSQKQYMDISTKAEKSKQEITKAMDKMAKTGKNADLVKANQVSLKLKVQLDQSEREYKDAVDKTNTHWKRLVAQISTMFKAYDDVQESKLYFMRSTFQSLKRLFNELVAGHPKFVIQDPRTSCSTIKSKSILETLQDLSQKNTRAIKYLASDRKQSFISYEEQKRRQARKQQGNRDTLREEQHAQIRQLINLWFTGGPVTKIPEKFDKVRLDIMTSPVHSVTFLECLQEKVQSQTSYYIKLEPDYFNDLLNCLILICRTFTADLSESSLQEIHVLLTLAMRIMKKNKDQKKEAYHHKELVSTVLGRERLFLHEPLWEGLSTLIMKKHKGEEESPLAFVMNGFKAGSKEKESEGKLSAIKELTVLMSSLHLPPDFSLPFLKKRVGEQQESLLEYFKETLYSKEDMKLRKLLTTSKDRALDRANTQLKLISNKKVAAFALELTAKSGLLGLDCLNLNRVCKSLRDANKWILFKLPSVPSKLFRLSGAEKRDYINMKTEVAQNTQPSNIEDIISMDVHRSLHLHAESLPPTVLHTLLRTFVYFNKRMSYCQGMNYVAGYLFVKTRDEEEAYLIFEKLMGSQMQEVFVNEFEALKVKMYQFSRLLNIYLPDLADHFKRQLILPECYLVAWIITLFSSTYQYTVESYMVDLFWQRFLVWGWPQFFKLAIWVHRYYKDELCELTFDRALHFLGAILKKPLFTSNREELGKLVDISRMAAEIEEIQVSQWLLDQLANQYELVKKAKPLPSS